MKRTFKPVFQIFQVAVIALTFIVSGPVFGAQSSKKPGSAPASVNMKKLVVGGGNPDLKVTALTVNPKTPHIGGGTITIKVTVKNRGTAATSAPCSLTMSVFSVDQNGNPIQGNQLMAAIPGYTKNIPILGPGKKHIITKYINLHHPGRNRIEGSINTESLQPGEESNTQNNYYRHYFTMKPKPKPADLVLHSIQATPDGRIKLKISNQGFKIPEYDFNRAWIKATIIGSSPYRQLHLKDADPKGILKKGQSNKYVTYTWPDTGPQGIKLTSGYSYTVEVILDCFPRIIDSNRSNNSRTVTLSP